MIGARTGVKKALVVVEAGWGWASGAGVGGGRTSPPRSKEKGPVAILRRGRGRREGMAVSAACVSMAVSESE